MKWSFFLGVKSLFKFSVDCVTTTFFTNLFSVLCYRCCGPTFWWVVCNVLELRVRVHSKHCIEGVEHKWRNWTYPLKHKWCKCYSKWSKLCYRSFGCLCFECSLTLQLHSRFDIKGSVSDCNLNKAPPCGCRSVLVSHVTRWDINGYESATWCPTWDTAKQGHCVCWRCNHRLGVKTSMLPFLLIL